jgi:hypothetical protein
MKRRRVWWHHWHAPSSIHHSLWMQIRRSVPPLDKLYNVFMHYSDRISSNPVATLSPIYGSPSIRMSGELVARSASDLDSTRHPPIICQECFFHGVWERRLGMSLDIGLGGGGCAVRTSLPTCRCSSRHYPHGITFSSNTY